MIQTPRAREKAGWKRRLAGWVLLAWGVVAAGVWLASRWWELGYSDDEWRLSLNSGVVEHINTVDPHRTATWSLKAIHPVERSICWWYVPIRADTRDTNFGFYASSHGPPIFSGLKIVTVVLWPLPTVLLGTGGLLCWSGIVAGKRARTIACARCGYSLMGLKVGAACPECGVRYRGADASNTGHARLPRSVRVHAVVFARLHDEELTLTAMPGGGMADGGVPVVVPIRDVPPRLRVPNSRLWVTMSSDPSARPAVERVEPRNEDEDPATK